MDLLGFRLAGPSRPDGSGGWLRVKLRLGRDLRQLRPGGLHVRCAGLRSPVLWLAARLLRGAAFALRQRLGRLLRGEGPVEGLLPPVGHWGRGLLWADACELPADAWGLPTDAGCP